MNDEDKAATERVAAALKKPLVSAQLRKIAKASTKSETDADDLVGAALVRVINPNDEPWDPRRRTFLSHMSYVMRQTWDRHVRRLSRNPRADDEPHRFRMLAVQRTLGERLLSQLAEHDTLARAIFDLCSREDLDPGEQADRLGCTVDEIRAAHKRLAHLGRKIGNEWEATEERRTKALRERATKPMNEDTP